MTRSGAVLSRKLGGFWGTRRGEMLLECVERMENKTVITTIDCCRVLVSLARTVGWRRDLYR
jgi:hypothetical protein